MTISSNNIYIKHWGNIVLMFFSVYRRIFFPSGTSCQCFKFSQSRRELALFKALAEFKASRRLGKYIRCFKCFCISVEQNLLFTSLQMSDEPIITHLRNFRKETTFLPDVSDNSLLHHSNDNKANYLFLPEYEPLSRCARTSPGHRPSYSRKTRFAH